MSPPIVSIIIPCFNASAWLAETLESAVGQSYPAIQVLVIDDGSTDDSIRIAQSFSGRGVQLFRQPNHGASAARNHGLRQARGDFIQFLDADDLLSPAKIARQVDMLIGALGTVATCRWGRFTINASHARFADDDLCRDFTPVEFLLRILGDGRMMHPAAWLTPRDVISRVAPWNEQLSLNDDGEYFARIALQASRIVHVPDATSFYRSQIRSSLSKRRDRRALESLFHSAELIAAALGEHETSSRVNQALADYWQRVAYELYPDAPDLSAAAELRSRQSGGSQVRPPLGRKQQRLARIIGWKLTRRLAAWRSR